jgi:amino-acid N-acetyltransferase
MAEKISKAPITVRAATARDAIAVRALIDLPVPSGVLLPRSEDFVATYAHNFVVAEAPGEGIVGCAYLDEYSPSIAELRSLAVAPDWQGAGVGRALVDGIEALARTREYATLFAVSNDEAYFKRYGFERREIPELDRERSEVSRYKGVYAKEL